MSKEEDRRWQLVGIVERLIQEANDEPQFSTREHALMAAGEIDREYIAAERIAAKAEALSIATGLWSAWMKLHQSYGSTAGCGGGIGGQAITSHCGHICDNFPAHEKDNERLNELYKRLRAEIESTTNV